jgi:outer membrane protease
LEDVNPHDPDAFVVLCCLSVSIVIVSGTQVIECATLSAHVVAISRKQGTLQTSTIVEMYSSSNLENKTEERKTDIQWKINNKKKI